MRYLAEQGYRQLQALSWMQWSSGRKQRDIGRIWRQLRQATKAYDKAVGRQDHATS